MTANRLRFVGQNRWHRFRAYDSQDHIGPAKRVQNQNRYLCVWSPGSHHVRGQSIRVTLHPAMCKFVIRSMVNCHDWIRTANDGVPLSRIPAAAVDTSKMHTNLNSGKSSVPTHPQMQPIHIPFLGQFVSLAVVFPQQSSIQCPPFRVNVQFLRGHA